MAFQNEIPKMSIQAHPKTKSPKTSSDIISNLPDSIISHILSFLPTVDAVATCVLSTKWINHWTNISNLTFNDTVLPFRCTFDENISKNSKFVSFVNRVLHFHRGNPLSKFTLYCFSNSRLYDISTWTSISIMKGVRELNLSIIKGNSVRLSGCIFNSATLEVLKLKGCIIIKVPNVVHLPNLTRLEIFRLDDEDIGSACELISRCDTLEELHLTQELFQPTLSLPNLKVLKFELVYFTSNFLSYFPSLESLVIIDPYHIDKFTISSSSLKYLKVKLPHNDDRLDASFELVLDTPALQDLYLDSCILMDVQVKDLRYLIRSGIWLDFSNTFNNISYYNATGNLFDGLSNVRILYLSWIGIRDTIPDRKFPKFPRLVELRVEVGCCACPLVQQFINNSNALQSLTLELERDNCEDTDSEPSHDNYENTDSKHIPSWKDHEIVPECLLSSFRRLEFYGFEGLENELAIVEYLLKNGRVLRNMVIMIRHSLDSDIKMNLLQKLLKFRRGSDECEMTVC